MNIHRMVRGINLWWPWSFGRQMLASARLRREMVEDFN